MSSSSFKKNCVLNVVDADIIAEGANRFVFRVPGRTDEIVKVSKTASRASSRRPLKRLLNRLFPNSRYRHFLKEAELEFLLTLKLGKRCAQSPLPKILGVVQTDLGPGIVTQFLHDGAGNPAPTLSSLRKSGEFDEVMLGHLNEMVAQIFDFQIVAKDFSPANVVYSNAAGPYRFWLVDGVGQKTLVPLRAMFRRVNDRALEEQMRIFARRSGLVWVSKLRAFAFDASKEPA